MVILFGHKLIIAMGSICGALELVDLQVDQVVVVVYLLTHSVAATVLFLLFWFALNKHEYYCFDEPVGYLVVTHQPIIDWIFGIPRIGEVGVFA